MAEESPVESEDTVEAGFHLFDRAGHGIKIHIINKGGESGARRSLVSGNDSGNQGDNTEQKKQHESGLAEEPAPTPSEDAQHHDG